MSYAPVAPAKKNGKNAAKRSSAEATAGKQQQLQKMQEKVPEPERCTQASCPAGFMQGSCLRHSGIHHTKLKRFHLVRLVSGHLVPCAECAHHACTALDLLDGEPTAH